MRAQKVSESMEFTRGQDSKRSLGIGVFKDMVKPDSLILPVIYQWGEITDKHGQPIIKAHRESGKTPLAPYERDQILKDVAELLNMAYGAKTVAESLDFTRGQNSKRALGLGFLKDLPEELVIDFPLKYKKIGVSDWQDTSHYIVDRNGAEILKINTDESDMSNDEVEKLFKTIVILLNTYYPDSVLAESYNFQRGQDSKKSLRVGAKYAPGAEKDFEDVEPGDLALDYNEMPHRVVAKIKGKYNSYGPEDLDQTADPIHQFVQRYDGTGAAAEMFYYPDESPVEEGEDLELIAVEDDHGIYVFTYGGDGAYAVWE